MTSGTTNVVRIYGSTYGDYGVQPDGAYTDPYADAPCINLWDQFDVPDEFDSTSPGAQKLGDKCAGCPMLTECRERARETDSKHGYHGFWAGLTPNQRKAEDVEEGAPTSREVQRAARAETVRKLAGQGLTDAVIGERIGVVPATVAAIRTSIGVRPGSDRRGGARGRAQIERERK